MKSETQLPFAGHLGGGTGAGIDWVEDLRRRGRDAYAGQGLPTPRVEAWKFTNLRRLAAAELAAPGTKGGDVALPGTLPEAALDAHRLVLVNGRFRPDLSDIGALPAGVALAPLADMLGTAPETLRDTMGALLDVEAMPLPAMNAAGFEDGAVLLVGDGVTLERPVHLVFLAADAADGAGIIAQPRLVVRLGENAEATLIETHAGPGTGFTNIVAEIAVGASGRLRHYKHQDCDRAAYHVATAGLRVGRRAHYDSFVLHTGAALARHEVRATIDGDHAELNLNGAYLVDDKRHIDDTTFVRHAAPDCRSRQVFKGVIDSGGRGVFQGKVLVDPIAQRTDAHQLSRALVLADNAEMDGKPELEIYADDVRCSHGATVGDLDESALFYLRSRGLPERVARRLLVEAFIADVLESIPLETVRDGYAAAASDWLDRRLGAPEAGR